MTDTARAIAEGLRRGDRASIARCISIAEDEPELFSRIIKGLYRPGSMPRVIGLTGPPGCGKSTLISLIVPKLVEQGHRVGVVAVDASSPFSGGSFLGNRIRMEEALSSKHVFMRSIATRGAKGGLSVSIINAIITLASAGFDMIVVESVGSGQADTDIANISSTVLLVLSPGLGDEVQAMKAGIMEIADIFVINKAELEGSDRAAGAVRSYLSTISGGQNKDIALTSCTSRRGIDELVRLIGDHESKVDAKEFAERAFRSEVSRIAKELSSRRVDALIDGHAAALGQMAESMDPYAAAARLLQGDIEGGRSRRPKR